MKDFSVAFFGVGGSLAVSSSKRIKYGTNTSCALVRAGESHIILDMGSGIVPLCRRMKAEAEQSGNAAPSLSILLSHYHYDHIEGFPFLSFPEGTKASIWAEGRNGRGTKELLFEYMSSPYFPVTADIYNDILDYKEIHSFETINLTGDVKVKTMPLNHPGSATGYRIEWKGKSIVSLLDYEHNEADEHELDDFCSEADLVLYDSFYTQKEYDSGKYKGWGHSTHERGVALAKRAGVKKLVLAHHANWRSDNELDTIGEEILRIFPNCVMAQEGQVAYI